MCVTERKISMRFIRIRTLYVRLRCMRDINLENISRYKIFIEKKRKKRERNFIYAHNVIQRASEIGDDFPISDMYAGTSASFIIIFFEERDFSDLSSR